MSHTSTTNPTRPLTRLWGFKPFTGLSRALTRAFARMLGIKYVSFTQYHPEVWAQVDGWDGVYRIPIEPVVEGENETMNCLKQKPKENP